MKLLFNIFKLFSKIPLRILYAFSDLIYFIIYYIIGYRKETVLNNLKNSFPNKSDEELKSIQKKFFKNFSDYIVETAKSLTISETELRVRMQHINQNLFKEAKDEGKNIIFLAGHVFNWEWISALANTLPQQFCYPVYRRAKNEFWNEQIVKIRNRFGNESVEAEEVGMHIMRNSNDGNSAYMLVADQSPPPHQINVGLDFLNQSTPVFIGYDKLAKRRDLAFIYCDMKKVKRGYYQVNYYRIKPDGDKFREYEVVEKFHQLLQSTIEKNPDNYLWSHRKWKGRDFIKNLLH